MAHMADEIRDLHVDVDPVFCDLARTAIANDHQQFDLVSETDPSDALDSLSDTRFDCLISDYEMPRMDGLELFEAVRKEHPDLPFVLYTGKGTPELARRARRK